MARTDTGSLWREAAQALRPPERVPLSTWLEANLRLPQGLSAEPGPIKLWPYQRGIADAIGDPAIERVTLVKPVRVGFTTLLTGVLAHHVVNDPAPVLCVLPTESDCRDAMVSDIEPTFDASPFLRGVLSEPGRTESGRNTILHRMFPGGSLKIVAAKAPRNLRRHSARVLMVDEADACEAGAEGNPISLAEKRTLSFANRKLIVGSTPLLEDTSHVLRLYEQSDGRVFEVPWPECGAFTEIMWAHIEFDPQPGFRCPHCKALIDESHKAEMGAWRVTKPEVTGHAGLKVRLALIEVELEGGTGGEGVDRRVEGLGSPAWDALEPDDGTAAAIANNPPLRGELREIALVEGVAEPDGPAACELGDDGRLDAIDADDVEHAALAAAPLNARPAGSRDAAGALSFTPAS